MEQRTFAAVCRALAKLNEMRGAEGRLEASPETVIAGPEGMLDSMGLINLLLFTEEDLALTFGQPVDIMDTIGERAANSASFTIGELVNVIDARVAELN